jgi:hypothetical protein
MAIHFPNHSRNHDEAHGDVRFWGYDAIVEVMFAISEEALSRIDANATDSAGYLRTFDAHRDRICSVASRVYVRGRQGTYRLAASDF